MNALKRILSAAGAAALMLTQLVFAASANEDEPELYLQGTVYEYDADRDYKMSSNFYIGRTSELETLGQLSVTGNMTASGSGSIPVLELDSSDTFTVSYTFCNALFNDDKFNWHIKDDSCSEVDGVKLGGRIGTGAIVIETSYDRENWTVAEKYLDILKIPEGSFDSRSYSVDKMQLTEGCYFRVIVAYKLEIQVDDTRFWFIDTSDKDVKRVAEVYEFYAGESSSEDYGIVANGNKHYVGSLAAAGDHSGYSGSQPVAQGDIHDGWKIGSFYLSGYSEILDDDILVKSPTEGVSLWFNLSQFDLARLHGDDSLSISSDTEGSDSYFGISGADFRRGALIVRRTDKDGEVGEPKVTADFLGTIDTPFSDKLVQVFDEGDYEVALDYRINKDRFIFDRQYDYRIFFKFRVRSSGCSISLTDSATGGTLDDAFYTENGFKLTSPSSDYLKVKVSYSRWTEKENGYTETRIFDRLPTKDELFEEEGIYTVTAVNPTTDPEGDHPYIKRIYTGTDDVLKAYASGKNPDMTVNMIAECLELGGTVAEDGTVIPPPEEESSSEAQPPERICAAAESAAVPEVKEAPKGTNYDSPGSSFPLLPLLVAAVTAGAAVFFLYVGRSEDD